VSSAMNWALESPRVVPGPLRSHRRWQGEQAFAQLACSLDLCSPETTQAVYVHVPFCQPRCRFCDLQCFTLHPDHDRGMRDRFCAALTREADWYAERTSRRPVSTIHFGGGTPLTLGVSRLDDLVRHLRASLGTNDDTEIAMEIRASDITDEALHLFGAAGIRRLHVGVQTLDDGLRADLDRRGDGPFVLGQLRRLLAAGCIVSVDVLYGLPGQTVESLLRDLSALRAVGVHGFAVYELHRTYRNSRLFDQVWRFVPNREVNLTHSREAARFLEASGFKGDFVTHFGRSEDHNLYSTHPQRGEDCMALGPMADGHGAGAGWRNAGYRHWLAAVESRGCGVDEVSLYLPPEIHLLEVERELMGGRLSERSLRQFGGPSGLNTDALIAEWSRRGLVKRSADGLALTDRGLWLHGNMIEFLRARVAEPSAATAGARP
jgi:coproporphyrinogen III oxidase-like Fe-S oxidoreductase